MKHVERTFAGRALRMETGRLAKQFDAVLYFDETRAVEPLERNVSKTGEVPATYPFEV